MAAPLWVLLAGTVVTGVLATTWPGLDFAAFLAQDRQAAWPHGPAWLLPLSVGLAVAGILLAWSVYQRRLIDAEALAALAGPLRRAAEQGYGVDALYLLLYRGALLGSARTVGWVDRYLVDGVVNVLSAWTLDAGDRLRRLQSGRAQDYLYGVTAGVLLLLVVWAWA